MTFCPLSLQWQIWLSAVIIPVFPDDGCQRRSLPVGLLDRRQRRSVVDLLNQVLQLFVRFATIGGGLWLVWGAVTFGGGLKDHNGPQTQSGLWQIVGGGMIIAAAQVFNAVALG